MEDLAEQARKVGLNISLTTHILSSVVGTATVCQPSQRTCKWTAANWGAGWIYGPDYLPTGESLYTPGAAANAGSYADPRMTQLITATITGPASLEAKALKAYAQYATRHLPVLFTPTQVGTYEPDAGTLVAKNLGG